MSLVGYDEWNLDTYIIYYMFLCTIELNYRKCLNSYQDEVRPICNQLIDQTTHLQSLTYHNLSQLSSAQGMYLPLSTPFRFLLQVQQWVLKNRSGADPDCGGSRCGARHRRVRRIQRVRAEGIRLGAVSVGGGS